MHNRNTEGDAVVIKQSGTHDVAVVGLTILDVLGRPIDRIPDGGGVDFIDEIRLTVAGTAGGTMVDCAKLGLSTLAVAAVGEDEKGDFVIDALNRFGVDTRHVQRTAAAPTSATILNVRSNGERPACHVRGASDHLALSPAQVDDIVHCRYLHMGGTGLLRAMDGAPTVALLKAAKDAGCVVTFDLIAPGPQSLALVEPCLPHVDYFMPSMEEAEALSGRAEPDAIVDFFLERGASCCVFKWGPRGSYVADAGGRERIPAFRVGVSDTTGCGDAYCAGFVAALHRGFARRDACRFATAASGLVATGLGSDAGIVDFEATLRFMETAEVLA